MSKKGYRLSGATGLHKGDRLYQQDQVGLFAHPRVAGCVLGVVADGMGGRTGGRKAADQVLLTARQLFERYVPHEEDPAALLRQIGHEAHMVIKLTAIAAEQEPHSTLAAFLILPGGACHCVHTGDSRIYHFHGVTLLWRTIDHSYVQSLIAKGMVTPEEAENHPQSNLLTGSLGTATDPPLELHHVRKLGVGDTLLACSDGLWHYFTSDELAAVLDTLPPPDASKFLIDKARTRAEGGGDNLSLVIVKFEPLEKDKPSISSAFQPLRSQ
ncbi:MAG: protein phosphatase 2C domain-containing protein [Burkholderiaceae bacterium]|jgi:serine/threonine protein phosphatase PrpC|nr:protein phosphatase 2C domain-containing protein [Burkholderiaceae bacterium]